MASKTSFDSEDFSLGRIDMLSVAPPQTVAFLKFRVMKAECLPVIGYNVQLFKDIDGEVPMNDNDPISHPEANNYPGYVADEPITVIYRPSSVKPERAKGVTGEEMGQYLRVIARAKLGFGFS